MNIVVNGDRDNACTNLLVKELYEHYARKLMSYTQRNYNLNEDDAWTLVYKTIYRIAEVYNKYAFENEQKRSAFIFKTHINYLRNYFRDNKAFEVKNSEVELQEKLYTVEEQVVSESIHLKILRQQLDLLEEWERILLLMRGQEIPYNKIAKFVDKPEKHLKVYYARLKKELLLKVNEELNKLNEVNNGKEQHF